MTPDTPSDPSFRSISVRGYPVTYTDEGEGPIICAIHGLPGDATDFRWLGPTLEKNHRFIRLNLPGFGQSSPKAGSLKWPDPAHFVADTLTALDLHQVTLLGHSYGTGVALAATLIAKDRVERLGLLAPFGLRPHKGFGEFPMPRVLTYVLHIPVVRQGFILPIRTALRKAGFKKAVSDQQIHRTIDAIASWDFSTYHSSVKKLKVPVFGAYCLDDHLIEPELMTELLSLCPNGPRLCFDTGGHNLQKTRAIEIGEALTHWLES